MLCDPAAACPSEELHQPASAFSLQKETTVPSCFLFVNSLGIQSCCLFLSSPHPPREKRKKFIFIVFWREEDDKTWRQFEISYILTSRCFLFYMELSWVWTCFKSLVKRSLSFECLNGEENKTPETHGTQGTEVANVMFFLPDTGIQSLQLWTETHQWNRVQARTVSCGWIRWWHSVWGRACGKWSGTVLWDEAETLQDLWGNACNFHMQGDWESKAKGKPKTWLFKLNFQNTACMIGGRDTDDLSQYLWCKMSEVLLSSGPSSGGIRNQKE